MLEFALFLPQRNEATFNTAPSKLPPWECCRIHRTRVVLAVVLALLALTVAPVASAQLDKATLSVSPSQVDATPGSPTLFDIQLFNPSVLARGFDLRVTNFTADWTYNLSAASVIVPANTTEHVTITIFTPEAATIGAQGSFLVHAYEQDTTTDAADPATITVNVVAPAAKASPSTPPTPKLGLLVTSTTVTSGETAKGIITILNGDTRNLRVRLTADNAPGWNTRLGDLEFWTLQPDMRREIPVLADAPAGITQATTRSFTVTALVDEGMDTEAVFTYAWDLTVQPVPASDAPPQEETTTDGTTTTPSNGSTTRPPTAAPDTFTLNLEKRLLEVAAGANDRTVVTLTNPTADRLTVQLDGEAPQGWIFAFETPTVTLEPGQARSIWMTLTAPTDTIPGGTGTAAVVATADGKSAQRMGFTFETIAPAIAPGATTDATNTAPIVDATNPADADTGLIVAGAVGLGVVGAAALALSRSSWRERIVWGAVGLYTRLLRPDVLRHEERERLHDKIRDQPGIHFHALQRELNWNTGTLTYHVRVLERHSFVVSRRDGLLRRFYVAGGAPRQETFEGPTGLRADVLEAIKGQPGISQSDLTLALGANKQTVNYHVKALERSGLLTIEKRGRDTYLHPQDDPAAATTRESASA